MDDDALQEAGVGQGVDVVHRPIGDSGSLPFELLAVDVLRHRVRRRNQHPDLLTGDTLHPVEGLRDRRPAGHDLNQLFGTPIAGPVACDRVETAQPRKPTILLLSAPTVQLRSVCKRAVHLVRLGLRRRRDQVQSP
ncbi:hypothetical protein [Micromonospora sp. WMMD812]|uniref:hypothetical protein n=1 Tax=Micromonospora sp. WMMD812 TaxID=3015152 RepID=UPI00248C2923|nr:hypothetical protein [Micromonospora sp. WMMD812]WBB69145.1 hypothetical protein O7603_07295 [Micromonospora sp. WMMD812]